MSAAVVDIEQSFQRLEEAFLDFLHAAAKAPDIIAVNVAAGIAFQVYQQITG